MSSEHHVQQPYSVAFWLDSGTQLPFLFWTEFKDGVVYQRNISGGKTQVFLSDSQHLFDLKVVDRSESSLRRTGFEYLFPSQRCIHTMSNDGPRSSDVERLHTVRERAVRVLVSADEQ